MIKKEKLSEKELAEKDVAGSPQVHQSLLLDPWKPSHSFIHS